MRRQYTSSRGLQHSRCTSTPVLMSGYNKGGGGLLNQRPPTFATAAATEVPPRGGGFKRAAVFLALAVGATAAYQWMSKDEESGVHLYNPPPRVGTEQAPPKSSGGSGSSSSGAAGSTKEQDLVALNKDEWRSFKLCHSEEVTHDTKKFKFKLPSNEHKLGLPVASCVITRAPIGENGAFVTRPYTPVTSDDERGYFELVVKDYPNKGTMSSHIHKLKPGDTLEVKGPIPKLPYTKNMKEKIGMIAGGTGITPMYQMIREILKHSDDKTQVSLIFANHTEKDILLRKELEDLAAAHPNFKVYHVLTTPPPNWKQGSGHVTAQMIKQTMPPPSDKNLVLVCGPPGFYELVSGNKAKDYTQGELSGLLKDLGYTKDQVFKF